MTRVEKKAAAYLRNGKIYLQPDSLTVGGLWIGSEPVLVTSEKSGNLGDQVLQVLENSTENVPHPASLATSDTWNATRALVKAAGARSYEAFADSTKCVGIKRDDTSIEFTPTLNGGYRRRFLYLKKKIQSRPVPADVAAALVAAFDACTEELAPVCKMTSASHEQLFAKFSANPPASPDAVTQCQSRLKFSLPEGYLRFLQQMNGGEGFIGENFLRAWRVEELIEDNKGYGADVAAPELFLFGSNGGGEAFAFDTRSHPPSIVMVPFIVIALEDAISIAQDFNAFLQRLYHSESLFDE